MFSDALNLAMVTLAKHYGVLHILARMRHSDFAEPLRLAGANHIISTVDLAVSTMVNAIEYPQVESMMHFEQGQIEVLKLSIANNCYSSLQVNEVQKNRLNLKYQEFTTPASKPIALYFMQKKTAVCCWS